MTLDTGLLLPRYIDNKLSVHLFHKFEIQLRISEEFKLLELSEFFLLQKNRQVLHRIFLKPQYKMQKSASVLCFNASFFDVPSFSKISQPTGQSQQNGKQCCLPPLSFKVSLKDTHFHIFKLLRALSLSKMLIEFPLTFILHHVQEKYLNFGVCIPRKCIQLRHFYSCPRFSKLQEEFFENLFPPTAERSGEN